MSTLAEMVSRYRLLLIAGGLLAVLAIVFAILVIPPLLLPPPEVGPGYDVFGEAFASTTLEPGRDHLVELDEQGVSAFIPQGALGLPGQIILKQRRPDLVPQRDGDAYTRLLAIDVLYLTPDGQVVNDVGLQEPLLLCFRLSPEQWAAVSIDAEAFVVEAYAEYTTPAEWLEVPSVPGWQPDQLCGHAEHLSLFSLSQRNVVDPANADKSGPSPSPSPSPIITVIPPGLYEPPPGPTP